MASRRTATSTGSWTTSVARSDEMAGATQIQVIRGELRAEALGELRPQAAGLANVLG